MTDARDLALPTGYSDLLGDLQDRVRATRTKALRTVNTQLIELYWSIGQAVRVQQEQQGWGSQVIRRLSEDLRKEFPDMKGLSARNIQYMTTFAGTWAEGPIAQQPAAPLPWGHIMVLLDKKLGPAATHSYAAAAVEYGWSRNVLLNMIMNKTLERTGAAPSNFAQQLAAQDSELAQQVAKDPYNFEFLGLSREVAERDLEQALMDRITDTLREMGPGFAFVGRQVHFDVGGDDFYLDLLFFHVEQLRYYVIELKTGKFQPEYAGKLNFYIALVDDRLRREAHADTVGILICGSKNEHTVRYSLGRATSPMAVASYTYDALPAEVRNELPDAGRLTAALDWTEDTED
ncbi:MULTISPECIES: PDDEXK nuclease domain-containing protein [Micrococcaceae]|jgi:predicted nuclease of restriction endonuclease-like (RecB) superfamily|uniref:PDDEXK nuclease domain-containing protein n=1 Tax=Micrococcaceae TaxID=1268 RepID=UPI00209796F7|nr:PDDEXK nuclease domain-containing protein [Arthrobacter sp. H16F315]MDD1478728.1 PDDEXK nuclease domain-containing protein [Arthrobacter sp. H16F315]MDD1478776.1 PDDEXK nuclease domain-containing protein [Arthrobacter sp. H16F315]